jgi:hypothetical protein
VVAVMPEPPAPRLAVGFELAEAIGTQDRVGWANAIGRAHIANSSTRRNEQVDESVKMERPKPRVTCCESSNSQREMLSSARNPCEFLDADSNSFRR